MKKQCNVILVPDDLGSIILNQNNWYLDVTGLHLDGEVIHHHLYITSKDKIEEGDWVHGMDGIFQYKGKVNIPDVELPKKIIATTNYKLDVTVLVPSISKSDLEWCVNKMKLFPLHFVTVEYENKNSGWQKLANSGKQGSTFVPDNYVPKVENGNIVIDRNPKEHWEKVLMNNGYTPQDIIDLTNGLIKFYESLKTKNQESWEEIYKRFEIDNEKEGMLDYNEWLQSKYNPPVKKS